MAKTKSKHVPAKSVGLSQEDIKAQLALEIQAVLDKYGYTMRIEPRWSPQLILDKVQAPESEEKDGKETE